MNTLTTETTDFLIELVRTLASAKMDKAVIDDLGARAIDESGTVALMGEKIPEFPGSLGLTRVSQLKSRLDLVDGKPEFVIEYSLNEEDFIKSLTFKAVGIKADYRTGNPNDIRAPKRVLDKLLTSFHLSTFLVSQLQSAIGAFGPAKNIQFSLIDGKILGLVEDENGDEFATDLGTTEYEGKITSSYDAVNVGNLLKLCVDDNSVSVGIGEKGILTIKKGEFTFYVMPSKRGNTS